MKGWEGLNAQTQDRRGKTSPVLSIRMKRRLDTMEKVQGVAMEPIDPAFSV